VLIGIGSLMLWRTTLIKRQPNNVTPDPVEPGSAGFTDADVSDTNSETSDTASSGPAPGPAPGPASSDAFISAMAILGSVERRNSSRDFRGGSVTAVMGRCEIDLRDASIVNGYDPVLEVFAMWGGIEIKVPTDWTIVSNVDPIMGGFEDDTRPPREGSKLLRVRGAVIMGGIEVSN
jgi:hypothetical protein